ncbi:MAG: hypothetical protein LBT03_01780 [Holosporales bacterium]|jgi:uncharacterized pyridoxal phosphate-containing UPF0001 family protein|nr:hypothetical protein [Holosporales bacterium]
MVNHVTVGDPSGSVYFMSFHAVGKNEIQSLLKKEEDIKSELKKLGNKDGVYSFKFVILKNEIAKVQNKLKLLSMGVSTDDDEPA